jgi:hypothetical protein
MAAAMPVLLSWAEVQTGKGGQHGHIGTVGRGQAHKLLQEAQEAMSGPLNDDNVRLVA